MHWGGTGGKIKANFDQILTSLETIIFGPPRPWGVDHRILEGRFPGVAKTLMRFEAKDFFKLENRVSCLPRPSQASQSPSPGGTGDQLQKQRTRKNSKSLRDFEFFLAISSNEGASPYGGSRATLK